MKKFLIIVVILFVVVLGAAALIPVIFKDDITAAIDKEIDHTVRATVYYDTDHLELTLFKNFPNITVGMSDFGVIGLLDIFGFESFVRNRFEQLCINYANEKLQAKFTEDIFRSVQEEYEYEGIPLDEIKYDDNTDVLDLIEGKAGLLAMLNEECVRPKGTDESFVTKSLAANKKSPCLIASKMNRCEFGIHHYAGKVMYDAEEFVVRNQDTLPTDLQDCALKCKNEIISKHLNNDKCSNLETKAPAKPAKKKTDELPHCIPQCCLKVGNDVEVVYSDIKRTPAEVFIRPG